MGAGVVCFTGFMLQHQSICGQRKGDSMVERNIGGDTKERMNENECRSP